MKYTRGYNPIKDHDITGKDMLVAALSKKTGKPEKELKKIAKTELRKMWEELNQAVG